MVVDSRKSKRRFARTKCEVVRERDFMRLGTRAIDLSIDGLFLMTDVDVTVGESVMIAFELGGHCVEAVGHIARVASGRRSSDMAMGIGIAFDSIKDDGATLLAAALKKMPPLLPAPFPMDGLSRRDSSRAPETDALIDAALGGTLLTR